MIKFHELVILICYGINGDTKKAKCNQLGKINIKFLSPTCGSLYCDNVAGHKVLFEKQKINLYWKTTVFTNLAPWDFFLFATKKESL